MKIKDTLFILMLFLSISIFAQSSNYKVGDFIEPFTAVDIHGDTVDLQQALDSGRVMLIFYLGEWCLYCKQYLAEITNQIEPLQNAGITVIAISPQLPAPTLRIEERYNISFPMIHDVDYTLMKRFGVAFSMDQKSVHQLIQRGVDLEKSNGNNDYILPVPATYLIDQNGELIYLHFDKDYRNRADVHEILSIP
jgi:peroxiredoxin